MVDWWNGGMEEANATGQVVDIKILRDVELLRCRNTRILVSGK